MTPGGPAVLAIADSAPPEPSATGARLEWVYQPWRETPLQATAALAFSVIVVALVQFVSGSTVLAVVLAIAFAAQLAPLLFATRVRVDDTGIAARGAFGWERRAWSEVGRVARSPRALLVSPYRTSRRLDRFRGLVLPLPRRDRETLIARLDDELRARNLA